MSQHVREAIVIAVPPEPGAASPLDRAAAHSDFARLQAVQANSNREGNLTIQRNRSSLEVLMGASPD